MTRLATRILATTMTILTVLCQTSLCQQHPNMEKAIQQLKTESNTFMTVEEAMESYGLVGLSVAVFENYEIVWCKTWGYKENGTAEKIDEQTAFSTASISKAITATLLVMLEEKGLIDLDKPVNDYLKRWKLPENEFTTNNPVTFKHLLSHTAGTTQHGFADFYRGDKIPSILESVKGELPRYDKPIEIDFAPGSQWRYSGGGYTLAQMAIEDHLGKSLAELAEEYIFEPLGMKHTTMYQDSDPKFLTNVAKVHDGNGEVIKTGIPICPQTAASAMWSSPTDMAIFMIEMQKALAGKQTNVISTHAANKVTEIATRKGVGGWSLGWERYHRLGNREWFSHGGANTGVGGHIYGTMEDGNGIAFFGNSPNQIRIPLLDKFRNSIVQSHGWKKANPYAEKAIHIDNPIQEAMTGLYMSPFQEFISIENQNGKLFISGFAGQAQSQLYRLNEHTFAIEEFNMYFQYQSKEKAASSNSSLAMVVEGLEDEPMFILEKISDRPTQPLALLKQGKDQQAKDIFLELQLPDAAKERMINNIGYQLLQSDDIEAAIATFSINVEMFPESANAYDSLGEAYLRQGNKEKAKQNYQKSLDLNPENEGAREILKSQF